jgi:hypothetical protein
VYARNVHTQYAQCTEIRNMLLDKTIAVPARHSAQLHTLNLINWSHYFKRNSMDFGPIVAIEHDSRSPCGLETFCLLRFWLMWVFEFSSFYGVLRTYVHPTSEFQHALGQHYFRRNSMDFGPIVAIEHDSRLPCSHKTFCLLRFWLLRF